MSEFSFVEIDNIAGLLRSNIGLDEEIYQDLNNISLIISFISPGTEEFIDSDILETVQRNNRYNNTNNQLYQVLGSTIYSTLIHNLILEEFPEITPGNLSIASVKLQQFMMLSCFMDKYKICQNALFKMSRTTTKRVSSEKYCSNVFQALIGVLFTYLFYEKNMGYCALNILSQWLKLYWFTPNVLSQLRRTGNITCSDIINITNIGENINPDINTDQITRNIIVTKDPVVVLKEIYDKMGWKFQMFSNVKTSNNLWDITLRGYKNINNRKVFTPLLILRDQHNLKNARKVLAQQALSLFPSPLTFDDINTIKTYGLSV